VDSLTSKAGGDLYNINGASASLTIDQDSRYGLNQNTSAILGTITPSASLRGNLYIDSTLVRLIPYDTGSGNVPADGSTISQGSASGKLIGVYSALNVAPTTAGSAMPASGYVKIKQWNSVAFAAGALTGLTANATGADVVGWIEVVCQEGQSILHNRLNTVSYQGAWYEVGVVPGTPARTDTYQIPTNGDTNQYHSGVQVETGSGTGIYEWWQVTPSSALVASVGTETTDSKRGHVCWISTSGVLRFGHDGTNSTGGGLPPAGARIRIGNLFLVNATSGAKTVNSLNATVANRFFPNTSAAGVFSMDKVSTTWRMNVLQFAQALSITNSAIYTTMTITTNSTQAVLDNICISSAVAHTAGALLISASTEGMALTNSVISVGTFGAANQSIILATAVNNIEVSDTRLIATGDKNAATNYVLNTSICNNITLDDCIFGVGVITNSQTAGLTCSTYKYYGAGGGRTDTANAASLINVSNKSSDISYDQPDYCGLVGSMQRNYTAALAAGSVDGFELKNLASYASPVDVGDAGQTDTVTSRSTTTCTVTHVAHGLRTGDTIVVTITDSPTGVITGIKTITVTGADTFTFTCLNAGSATPTITYYVSYMQGILSCSTSVFNVTVQNFNVVGNSSAPYTGANSSKTIVLQNVLSDPRALSLPTKSSINVTANSVMESAAIPAVSTSTYGTIFGDSFIRPITIPQGSGVSWTRSAAVITVTKANHGLYTGDRIQVSTPSDPASIPSGLYSVTALTSGTFTLTGVATGSASGTLDYRVEDSRLLVLMNEKNADTTNYYTIDAGTPGFTGSGTLSAPTVGDQITWTMPDFIFGYTSFPNILPSITGLTNAQALAFDFTYAIDTGSGYGSFQNLAYPRAGGGGTSGLTTVTMTSTTGVAAGDRVYGIGIADGAEVVSVDSATNITVSIANVATVSGTLVFAHLPEEASLTSTGFKLKVRLLTNTTNTTPISAITIPMTSDATSRARLYPQAVDTVSFSISNIPVGSIVALYDNTDTELKRENNVTSGVFTYEYIHSGVDFEDNYYVFWHEDYYPVKSDLFDLTATDLGVSVTPVDDLAFDAAAPDISTFDYPNKIHVMDPTVTSGGDVDIPLTDLYSNWKDDITLSDNFTYDFAYRVIGGEPTYATNSISINVFQDNGWKLRPREINHTGRITGGNLIPESGGAILPTVGTYTALVEYQNPERSIAVTSGGLVTTVAEVADAVWDEAKSAHTTTGTFGKSVADQEKFVKALQ